MKKPAYFFRIFQDARDFDFRGINLAKYFYDLWVTHEEMEDIDPSAWKNRNKHAFFRHPPLCISAMAKCLKMLLTQRGKIIFFGSENRLTQEGSDFYDLYNYNIIRELGKERVLVLQDRHDSAAGKQYSPDLVMDDLAPFFFLCEKALQLLYRKDMRAFVRRLAPGLEQIGFTEKTCQTRLLKFYVRFLFYKAFLKTTRPAAALIICHYARHAFTAACKNQGCRVAELMHGHILPSHRFYNIPGLKADFLEKFRQTFLPDTMAVYGNFWKEILTQSGLFKESQIINIGFYLKVKIPKAERKSKKGKTILITSNPQVQEDLIHYVRSIQAQVLLKGYRIVIKPHPTELDASYQSILDGNQISIERKPVYELLSQADIHISVASSTLFDALLFDVQNFVLLVERYRDICQEILDTRIAAPLKAGQLPEADQKSSFSRKHYMDTPHIEALLGALSIPARTASY